MTVPQNAWLTHAPWLSWLERMTVISHGAIMRSRVQASLGQSKVTSQVFLHIFILEFPSHDTDYTSIKRHFLASPTGHIHGKLM